MPTGSSLHPVTKLQVADCAQPRPGHRWAPSLSISTKLSSCAAQPLPLIDPLASPPSPRPPQAAGKGHLRLGEGRPTGPWARWHPPEAFTPAVLSRISLSLLLSIPSGQIAVALFGLAPGSQSSLSLFFSSLASCLSLSPIQAYQPAPGGTRCLLLWSNLSPPTVSRSAWGMSGTPHPVCLGGVPESWWSRLSIFLWHGGEGAVYPVPGTIAVSNASSIPLHTNTERGGAAGAQVRRP